ncbi:MAG: hypothetical protein R3D98_15460 [Candidatus Krumholzibacteriia bacterium]
MLWKPARGKLGRLAPLLGAWRAEADTERGPLVSTRRFRHTLGKTYVQLDAVWRFTGSSYEETALFGVGPSGDLEFWSFTSDGKHSRGRLADVGDLHPRAVGFEAEMPAGLARQAYWPDDEDGIRWVVEARTKKGWNRMVDHLYLPDPE